MSAATAMARPPAAVTSATTLSARSRRAAIIDDDASARGAEQARGRGADSAAGARDDHNFGHGLDPDYPQTGRGPSGFAPGADYASNDRCFRYFCYRNHFVAGRRRRAPRSVVGKPPGRVAFGATSSEDAMDPVQKLVIAQEIERAAARLLARRRRERRPPGRHILDRGRGLGGARARVQRPRGDPELLRLAPHPRRPARPAHGRQPEDRRGKRDVCVVDLVSRALRRRRRADPALAAPQRKSRRSTTAGRAPATDRGCARTASSRCCSKAAARSPGRRPRKADACACVPPAGQVPGSITAASATSSSPR